MVARRLNANRSIPASFLCTTNSHIHANKAAPPMPINSRDRTLHAKYPFGPSWACPPTGWFPLSREMARNTRWPTQGAKNGVET